ncbi:MULTISPECIES: ABC transporter ATP-binding protein [unclassified Pseudomonas]|uniref:ABC transporter ATP-binding protein n=1 Tax=unclassified Pseudomonas TaxID=196821 RepID=UPI0019124240|nr:MULTISPECIES: ABC transporter ATP-binding protein [unclassified Pseudomonas]
MTGALLTIRDVGWTSPRSGSGVEPFTLKNIYMRIESGEFVGLIGPNGGGKTSLLRCAMRYSKPESGVVGLSGDDLWAQSARWSAQRIAVVGQEFPSTYGLSVREVVAMGRIPYQRGFQSESTRDRVTVNDALETMGLVHLQDHDFGLLSGGEKQRTLLARAVTQDPQVLILDEPTNHLDPKHQVELLAHVKKLGVAVIASLHDLNLAAAFCDRLYVIKDGRITAQGRPWDVLTPDNLFETYGVEALVDAHPQIGTPRITWKIV